MGGCYVLYDCPYLLGCGPVAGSQSSPRTEELALSVDRYSRDSRNGRAHNSGIHFGSSRTRNCCVRANDYRSRQHGYNSTKVRRPNMPVRLHLNRFGWIIMNIMLMLTLSFVAAKAQDQSGSGSNTPSASAPATSSAPSTSTAPSSSGSAVEHSSSHSSSTTTTTSGPDVTTDSNTWLIITIAVIAFLVLVIVIARAASSSRKSVSRTTVVR